MAEEVGVKDPFVRQSHRVDPADNIIQQARQGSIAAIVQVLNDNLAESGVRTRAVFAEGWLQLLCEAPNADRLEQSDVVESVRQLLEAISPRNIRRVNLNCRIAREEQLLWLEEINRNPDKQLLWSQQLILRRPNPINRLADALKASSGRRKVALPKKLPVSQPTRSRDRFQQGLFGGLLLSVLLLLGGIWFYRSRLDAPDDVDVSTPSPTPEAEAEPDAFVQAVRLAEQASIEGQTATTRAQWLDLAAKWQRAADLMARVPAGDARYQTAVDRTQVYRQNSEVAQQRAETAVQ
ncbi:MAG: hypothetical protein J7641_13205 [Cyanobacteria bacterium SID2]|nr:hypothetical protein [Cyanobacteria bacterium SID2]MBP0005726.1 hypothetical protein [Cyanobacteria bacterium SBC]